MIISKFLKKYISGDLISTGLNQFWRLISGPVTLILIPLFLNQEVQGYWFTFISLAALVVLADLGFSNIILQFAAHEFAYLQFTDQYQIIGDEKHLKKLAAFFIFSVKWTLTIICIAFPVIMVVGSYLLSQKETVIAWSFPWIVYVTGSALMFFNSTMLYFFEGCDSVGIIQKIRLKISIITVLIMWVGLLAGFNLFALSLSLLLSSCVGLYFIFRKFEKIIKDFIKISRTYTYSWKKEFFALLWKYALSWASGYFIFQMYTPLMFFFHGPAEAGKVGISFTLWTALFNIATLWIYVITPKLNISVSKKDWRTMDSLFVKNLLLAGLTFLIGATAVLLIIFFLKGKVPVIDRFLNMTPMLFLASAWFFQVLVNGLAVYLRAHKEEALVIPSVISAVYIVITTFLCSKYLTTDYFFLGYLSSYFYGFPWVIYIFNKKRKSHSGVKERFSG